MNQFIIENPVLCIVIAFIIGAVIMNITSALTVRMAVEKEVTKALGEEDVEEETRASGNVQEEEDTKEPWARRREELWKEITENSASPTHSAQVPKIDEVSERLHVGLGVDEDGCRCLYLAKPDRYKKGEGPLADLGHDYYYHPTLQFLVDDFDLDKLAELGINIKSEVEYEPMSYSIFKLEDENVLKFLEEAFNACGKAILRRE